MTGRVAEQPQDSIHNISCSTKPPPSRLYSSTIHQRTSSHSTITTPVSGTGSKIRLDTTCPRPSNDEALLAAYSRHSTADSDPHIRRSIHAYTRSRTVCDPRSMWIGGVLFPQIALSRQRTCRGARGRCQDTACRALRCEME